MEGVLGEIMFETPSDPTIDRILITEDCVEGKGKPEYHHNPAKKPVRLTLSQSANTAPRQRRGSVS